MERSILNFVGSGSAFNTKLGCNSAYILKGDSLLLIDCGGGTFEKLKNLGVLNEKIKKVVVLITHCHPDHVGSLGDVIYYVHYVLKTKAKVVCADLELRTFLSSQKVPHDIYEFNPIFFNGDDTIVENIFLDKVSIKTYQTNHYPNMITTGFLFAVDNVVFYYSGDSYEIPEEILIKFLIWDIDYIYQDTCGLDYDDNPHMSLDRLMKIIPYEHRNRVYCMHLDEAFCLVKNKAIEEGFSVVVNIFEELNT